MTGPMPLAMEFSKALSFGRGATGATSDAHNLENDLPRTPPHVQTPGCWVAPAPSPPRQTATHPKSRRKARTHPNRAFAQVTRPMCPLPEHRKS